MADGPVSRFRDRFDTGDHRDLAGWAALCAERVLPLFEGACPDDRRPREAIAALREWIATGRFSMSVIRAASLGAHAAARAAGPQGDGARFAARAAGQAVATAHVPTHALGAALYARKAVAAATPAQARERVAAERDWQRRHMPPQLRPWLEETMPDKERLLPPSLRERGW